MSQALKIIRTSAPGKLMLFGEHAVLYGFPCLVAAVTPRAHVQLRTRDDDQVVVLSELGEYRTRITDIPVETPFTFVLEALRRASPRVGLELTIACDFPAVVGLGSSAAVTVAVVAALKHLSSGTIPVREDVFVESLAVVRNVQGKGSGADLAASVFGGVLHLKSGGAGLRPIDCHPQLQAVYSGSKEKTTVVIEKVQKAMSQDPGRFYQIYREIGGVVDAAAIALAEEDWPEVGKLMARNQELMVEMGVSNDALDSLVSTMRQAPGILGAKISGAGLGDCVWGLGELEGKGALQPLDLELDTVGLRID